EDPQRRKWKVAEIESLRRVGENLDLNEAQRRLLDEEIAAAVAALALGDAYHHISLHEYGPAVECFRSANAYYRDSRIRGAAFCLHAWPWLAGPVLNWRLRRRPVRKISRRRVPWRENQKCFYSRRPWEKCTSPRSLASAAEAEGENGLFTAALKRRATQNQAQHGLLQQAARNATTQSLSGGVGGALLLMKTSGPTSGLMG